MKKWEQLSERSLESSRKLSRPQLGGEQGQEILTAFGGVWILPFSLTRPQSSAVPGPVANNFI